MSIIIDGKEYYGIIYKIENLITNHVYIGQTTSPDGFNGRYTYSGTGIERVYKSHLSKKEHGAYYNPYLLRAIEKYGFYAFTIDEVFDTAISQDDLNYKEKYYIEKFDSYKNGYNLTRGGDGITGCKGAECKNSKRVCQIDLNGELIKIWDSVTDACNELGTCPSSISNVCNGKQRRKGGDAARTAGGYIWVFEKDYDPDNDYRINKKAKNGGIGDKQVLLLSSDGNIINEFESINEASRMLGICVESVRKTCLHKFKNPRYNLKYKSEYIEEQRLSVGESYEIAS